MRAARRNNDTGSTIQERCGAKTHGVYLGSDIMTVRREDGLERSFKEKGN